MPPKNSSQSSRREDVVDAARVIYDILQTHNIPACAIGSTAIVCSTTRSHGRDPNSVDFLTFQKGHNQHSINKILSASHPDLFAMQEKKDPSSHLPPLLYYRPLNSRKRLRVFFLPLWTRHSQANIPTIGIEEVRPKSRSTVPVPPLPYVLYLQVHGWAWNSDRLGQQPLNKSFQKKRDNFAHDICVLLAWAVKKRAHFDWLSEEFSDRLLDAAAKFVQGHPATVDDWKALGVEVEVMKPQANTKHSRKQPAGVDYQSKKGTQATRLLKEQLGDLEFDQDHYHSDY